MSFRESLLKLIEQYDAREVVFSQDFRNSLLALQELHDIELIEGVSYQVEQAVFQAVQPLQQEIEKLTASLKHQQLHEWQAHCSHHHSSMDRNADDASFEFVGDVVDEYASSAAYADDVDEEEISQGCFACEPDSGGHRVVGDTGAGVWDWLHPSEASSGALVETGASPGLPAGGASNERGLDCSCCSFCPGKPHLGQPMTSVVAHSATEGPIPGSPPCNVDEESVNVFDEEPICEPRASSIVGGNQFGICCGSMHGSDVESDASGESTGVVLHHM